MVAPMRFFLLLVLAVSVPAGPAPADPPRDARPITADAALACVAGRYRGEALRIREEDRGLLQELRWVTPAGNVLDIELTGPGCRFLKVEGVGQSEARIPPGTRP